MLTRIEAHGFKNLLNFSVDFGPFTCIAGPNGVGKSNVFDAIRFLSLLADYPIMEAAQRVRNGNENRSDRPGDEYWEPKDIFWTDGIHSLNSLSLAAEMIVEREVQDDFGRPAAATSTFLRYEVEIGYEEPKERSGFGRLKLVREELDYVTKGESHKHLCFDHSKSEFRDHIVVNNRRSSGYISTERADDGKTEILVHQDGGSRGQPKRAPADSAPRTIVGTTNTSSTPTVLAARREMQQWRLLALEPTSMRGSDRFHTDPHITSDGDHLAATLNRLAQDGADGEDRLFSRISGRLNELLTIDDIRVDVDDERRLLTLEVKENEVYLPARALSDGTLRFLTLSILEQDPEFRGLLCMEEPENGIHPARISSMVDLLYDLAVDPDYPPGNDNVMRQIVVATHSPTLVKLVVSRDRNDLLHAELSWIKNPVDVSRSSVEALRCRPLSGTLRAESQRGIGQGSIINYLTTPPEANFGIDFVEAEKGLLD
jgi:predicted ATPase